MPSTALASPARVRAGVLMGALPAALLLAALVAGVALGLAVTLVWLYTEILRLLSYVNDR